MLRMIPMAIMISLGMVRMLHMIGEVNTIIKASLLPHLMVHRTICRDITPLEGSHRALLTQAPG